MTVGLFSLPLACSLFFAIVLTARVDSFFSSALLLSFSFSMVSLDGLLGCFFFTRFVKQKLRIFQRTKNSSTWYGGGSVRSSDVYTKSRGVAFFFVYLFSLLRDALLVTFVTCVSVSVRMCVWWYSFVYLRIGYFALNGVLFCFVFLLGELIFVFFRFVFSFACLDKEIKTILLHYV